MDKPKQNESRPKTILLIDDDIELLKVNSKLLSVLGYQILTASRGETGLDLLKSTGADLVILDMLMPGMDGVQTLRQIRAILPEQKVIILSGFAEDEQTRAVSELGILAYLRKPTPLRTLNSTIRNALLGIPSDHKDD